MATKAPFTVVHTHQLHCTPHPALPCTALHCPAHHSLTCPNTCPNACPNSDSYLTLSQLCMPLCHACMTYRPSCMLTPMLTPTGGVTITLPQPTLGPQCLPQPTLGPQCLPQPKLGSSRALLCLSVQQGEHSTVQLTYDSASTCNPHDG